MYVYLVYCFLDIKVGFLIIMYNNCMLFFSQALYLIILVTKSDQIVLNFSLRIIANCPARIPAIITYLYLHWNLAFISFYNTDIEI